MKTSGFPRPRLPDSAARNDVRNQVSVDPVDDAGIDISHLEQRWNLWVSGTAIHPDHICHTPSTIRVGDDHRVAWFDVQKNGIRLGRCNGACMVNRHTPVLIQLYQYRSMSQVQEWILKRSIFEVLRSYMVSFAMAALRSVFFIQR